MRKIGRFALWVLSVFVFLIAVAAFFDSFSYGVVLLISGLLFNPIVGDKVKAKTNKGWLSPMLAVACILVVGPTVSALSKIELKEKEAPIEMTRNEADSIETEEDLAAIKAEEDRLAIERRKQELSGYINLIDRELVSISNLDTSNYTKDLDSIKSGLLRIERWVELYREGMMFAYDEQTQAKRNDLYLVISKKQAELLPKMRDAFGPAARKVLWESDGSAKTIGRGFTTVDFVAPLFAANRNIKSFHTEVREVLMKLRFKRAQYRWFSGASEYSYYDLDSPNDTDVVEWLSGGDFSLVK